MRITNCLEIHKINHERCYHTYVYLMIQDFQDNYVYNTGLWKNIGNTQVPNNAVNISHRTTYDLGALWRAHAKHSL